MDNGDKLTLLAVDYGKRHARRREEAGRKCAARRARQFVHHAE